MRPAASRIRWTKCRARSGSPMAPSSNTSALARTAATGFFNSCDKSAAKVSTNGRPSSCRRIESSALANRSTSRPPDVAGTAGLRSPVLTCSANVVSFSIGWAIARPIRAAARAAAAPNMRLITSTVGAKSASMRSTTTVGLTTRTRPTARPATVSGACTVTTAGSEAIDMSAGGNTRVPCVSYISNLRSAPLLNSCSSRVTTGVKSPEDRAISATKIPVSAVTSSSAA